VRRATFAGLFSTSNIRCTFREVLRCVDGMTAIMTAIISRAMFQRFQKETSGNYRNGRAS
jgi:hypothetical protein